MDPRILLLMEITDRIATLVIHAQEVAKMSKEQALAEIEEERVKKDSLVEEVTL